MYPATRTNRFTPGRRTSECNWLGGWPDSKNESGLFEERVVPSNWKGNINEAWTRVT
jgi:hypothetical protein